MAFMLAAALTAGAGAWAAAGGKPQVVILATCGGTIADSAESAIQAGDTSGQACFRSQGPINFSNRSGGPSSPQSTVLKDRPSL